MAQTSFPPSYDPAVLDQAQSYKESLSKLYNPLEIENIVAIQSGPNPIPKHCVVNRTSGTHATPGRFYYAIIYFEKGKNAQNHYSNDFVCFLDIWHKKTTERSVEEKAQFDSGRSKVAQRIKWFATQQLLNDEILRKEGIEF